MLSSNLPIKQGKGYNFNAEAKKYRIKWSCNSD